MSAFYNSVDFTLSLEVNSLREMFSENHNALRKDGTIGLVIINYQTKPVKHVKRQDNMICLHCIFLFMHLMMK